VITSSSDSSMSVEKIVSPKVLIGKHGRKGASAKWHVYRKDGEKSLCNQVSKSRTSRHVDVKQVDLRETGFDEEVGLGSKCRFCQDYCESLAEGESVYVKDVGSSKGENGSLLNKFRNNNKTEVIR